MIMKYSLFQAVRHYLVIAFHSSEQRALVEQEEYRSMVASGSYEDSKQKDKKKRIKKSDYFSDEEELSDWRTRQVTSVNVQVDAFPV